MYMAGSKAAEGETCWQWNMKCDGTGEWGGGGEGMVPLLVQYTLNGDEVKCAR